MKSVWGKFKKGWNRRPSLPDPTPSPRFCGRWREYAFQPEI